jgi:ornithine cyclodeaminase/alanine dehydrogenase-like protein (mu-crystallin family)
VGTGWRFSEVGAYDLVEGYAESFLRHAAATGAETIPYREGRDLLARSDLVVFATTAARPYVEKGAWLDRGPLVLHLSLRDLSPSVVHEVANVVDDVDHVFQANTSLQLAEAETGDRSFVTGTLHDVLSGRVAAPADGPVVFSPFGLGVLDVALAKHVYDEAIRAGTATLVPGFFHELSRHGA